MLNEDKLGALSLIMHALVNAEAEISVAHGYYIVTVNKTMTLMYDGSEVSREEIQRVIDEAKS